jgi:hypothetical protein
VRFSEIFLCQAPVMNVKFVEKWGSEVKKYPAVNS